MKKALFFDIDGTLLDENNFITKSAAEGIHRLQANGNYAFLCTGRSRAFVRRKELLDIGFDGLVSGCGTMIEFHDEVIYYRKLEEVLVQKTIAYLKRHQAATIMEGRFHLYLDEDDFGDDRYVVRLREEMGEDLLPIGTESSGWEVSKFSCVTKDSDLLLLKQDLEKDYELLLHSSEVMELVPKGCSKGTGILKVCEKLGIDRADTYAFGDSVNDLPMFEVAGHSIAMGNGTELVKQKASYVTDSLHNDGIYHALEHFGLF